MTGQNKNITLPISRLIAQLEEYPVKVLWEQSFQAEYNRLFEAFYSFCKLKSGFISLHGEMNIETFHKRREQNAKVAKLYKCEYEFSEADGRLVQKSKTYIGLGADPRIVSDGENAYAYVTGYGEAGHPALLYVASDDTLHPLKAPPGFAWGKNWQPYLKEKRLFIVHELTPYRIYEVNLATYELEARHLGKTDLALPAHFTNHTMFRGGANAISAGDFVYGVGRASAQPYKHYPFFWSSEDNAAPVIQLIDYFCRLDLKGFGILDPTSFFNDGQNVLLGLACSETCWFHAQQFLNILLVIDVEDRFPSLPTLDDYLSEFEDRYIDHKPNLARHMFHCDRMQHAVAHTYEYGVKSVGIPGVLVYGPYSELESDTTLAVELSYLTMQAGKNRAGTFDINLSKASANGEVEFIEVAQCELKHTDREIERATLYFDTAAYIGYKAEFRVHVEQDCELNAFHIRTTRVSKSTPIPDYRNASRDRNLRSFLRKLRNAFRRIFRFDPS